MPSTPVIPFGRVRSPQQPCKQHKIASVFVLVTGQPSGRTSGIGEGMPSNNYPGVRRFLGLLSTLGVFLKIGVPLLYPQNRIESL